MHYGMNGGQGGNGIFGSRHPQFRTTGPVPVPGKSLLAGLLKDLLTVGLLKTPWFAAGWPAEGCLPCGTRVDFVHICRNVTLGFRRQWLKVCTCGRSQFFPRSIFPALLAGWPPLFRLSIPPGSALVRQVKAENFRPGCGGVKRALGSKQSVVCNGSGNLTWQRHRRDGTSASTTGTTPKQTNAGRAQRPSGMTSFTPSAAARFSASRWAERRSCADSA